jgi:transcriptional regulator with XRE-family HTH domain
LREQRGLSTDELAGRLGIDPAFVRGLEQGEVDARWRTVLRILRALDMGLRDLAPLID